MAICGSLNRVQSGVSRRSLLLFLFGATEATNANQVADQLAINFHRALTKTNSGNRIDSNAVSDHSVHDRSLYLIAIGLPVLFRHAVPILAGAARRQRRVAEDQVG